MPNLKSELEMLANYREDNIPSPAIQFMHIHARRALEAFPDGELFEEKTPEAGVIRLNYWDGHYVLYYHGERVWKSPIVLDPSKP